MGHHGFNSPIPQLCVSNFCAQLCTRLGICMSKMAVLSRWHRCKGLLVIANTTYWLPVPRHSGQFLQSNLIMSNVLFIITWDTHCSQPRSRNLPITRCVNKVPNCVRSNCVFAKITISLCLSYKVRFSGQHTTTRNAVRLIICNVNNKQGANTKKTILGLSLRR